MLITSPRGDTPKDGATSGGRLLPQSQGSDYGSLSRPEDPVPSSSSEAPLLDAPENVYDQQGRERGHITVLVIGPSGSGKSTFIASVSDSSRAEANAVIGHGLDPCTVTCSAHEVIEPLSGTRLTLLDTPGFNDQNRSDLDILSEIASFLTSKNLPPIWAIVFTHAITENRVTGSSRLNLNIAKALCGEGFYSRLALLTTMWNKIPTEEAQELCVKRESQILASPTFWGQMNDGGCQHARFDGTPTSGMHFIKQLLDLGPPSPGSFAYEVELGAGATLEQTKAGAIIMAEREKRRQQLEAELQEEQLNQREEMEQAEMARQQLFRSQGIDYGHDHGPNRARPVVRHAPSRNDPMAYGQLNEARPDRASAGGRMVPRTRQQPETAQTYIGISFGNLRQWAARGSR